MVCERIDIRARVNYFSRNSEPRYRLRNPCATGYASKVNIMHFSFPSLYPNPISSLSPSFPSPILFFLCSRHFRARQREDLSRGEARQNLTPTLPATGGDASPSFQNVINACVHVRFRQRCNAVPRAPLSSRRISCFVDFVSSIRPARERKLKGDVSA